MKRAALLLAGGAFLLGSASLALAAPEDLLPPSFGNPAPAPAPAPAPSVSRPSTPRQDPGGSGNSNPVVQQVPGGSGQSSSGGGGGSGGPSGSVSGNGGTSSLPSGGSVGNLTLPANFPSLAELEAMETDEVDQLLGLKPKFDIPAGARRSMQEVGLLARSEGGFANNSLSNQPAALVRAALVASDGPLVSRWGHILMRRVLSSRLNAPAGLDPVEFAALRANALNAMGEGAVARALVQDIDGSNYDLSLTNAAFGSYIATGDVLGMCPVARLQPTIRDDAEWEMMQQICTAYVGDARSADRRLQRLLGQNAAPEIDIRLAQRFAGAGGEGRRAVTIEWDGVSELNPWRFSLARALGVEIPDNLRNGDGAVRYDLADVQIPASPLLARVNAAERAGARGVLSASAMVDLYSQLYASDQYTAAQKASARQLRAAYVAREQSARIAAMRGLWGEDGSYGMQVLTAFAAARMPVADEFSEDAAQLVASMLAAGLDRNALRWGNVVPEGSQAWGLLVLAQPERQNMVDTGAISSFSGSDESEDGRKTQFLVAGLAGLGRVAAEDVTDLAEDYEIGISRQSVWSERITAAAEQNNAALVALLAGLGMQGTGWDRMTARQLYFIVRSLNQVGLSAEARMIAAEAVARG